MKEWKHSIIDRMEKLYFEKNGKLHFEKNRNIPFLKEWKKIHSDKDVNIPFLNEWRKSILKRMEKIHSDKDENILFWKGWKYFIMFAKNGNIAVKCGIFSFFLWMLDWKCFMLRKILEFDSLAERKIFDSRKDGNISLFFKNGNIPFSKEWKYCILSIMEILLSVNNAPILATKILCGYGHGQS